MAAEALLSAGLLLEERLQDGRGAAEAYREAFTQDRNDPVLLAVLARVAARDQRDDELLRVLAAEAENAGQQGGAAFLELGKGVRAARPARRTPCGDPPGRPPAPSPETPLVLSTMAGLLDGDDAARSSPPSCAPGRPPSTTKPGGGPLPAPRVPLRGTLHRDQPGHAELPRHPVTRPREHLGPRSTRTPPRRPQDWPGLLEVYDADSASPRRPLAEPPSTTVPEKSADSSHDPDTAVTRSQRPCSLAGLPTRAAGPGAPLRKTRPLGGPGGDARAGRAAGRRPGGCRGSTRHAGRAL